MQKKDVTYLREALEATSNSQRCVVLCTVLCVVPSRIPDGLHRLLALVCTTTRHSHLARWYVRACSPFDRYCRELASGLLDWSTVHTTMFWRSHHRQFEAREFALLRRLGELLTVSTDMRTVAVACYDLGEFARHHTNGRGCVVCVVGPAGVDCWRGAWSPACIDPVRPAYAVMGFSIVRQLGLKTKLMEQLSRPDSEVQKQALLACSKIMVDSWQFVATDDSGGGGGGSVPVKGKA